MANTRRRPWSTGHSVRVFITSGRVHLDVHLTSRWTLPAVFSLRHWEGQIFKWLVMANQVQGPTERATQVFNVLPYL